MVCNRFICHFGQILSYESATFPPEYHYFHYSTFCKGLMTLDLTTDFADIALY